MKYEDFLASKRRAPIVRGVDADGMADGHLFPHQRDLVRWALARGRAAIFAATGLGKSRMQMTWAREVHDRAGVDVLVLAPLAVAAQTVAEAETVGIAARVVRDGADVAPGISVTNYDRLHRFDPSRFGAVVLDESSIIKSFSSGTLADLLAAFGATRFRLACTATPSPNDYTELGTHAEFLGVCTRAEMLAEYFCHDGGETQTWRLKGHARAAFWRWVSTWGALVRAPSDLGYSDDGYALPGLSIAHHRVAADHAQAHSVGMLFADHARTLSERRLARKGSTDARVRECAELVNASEDQWIVWCELNAEGDALTGAIPGAVQVAGSDTPEDKETRLLAFARGGTRVLVTKPKIAGWGMNFQACARMAFVGVNDSFESQYQAIRRCYRFGQTRPVEVHIFSSELEGEVSRNLERKAREAEAMGEELAAHTRTEVMA